MSLDTFSPQRGDFQLVQSERRYSTTTSTYTSWFSPWLASSYGTYNRRRSQSTLDVYAGSQDTAVGTGVRSFRIIGINEDFFEEFVDVVPTGGTKYTTTKELLDVYSVKILASGSQRCFDGDTRIINTSDSGSILNVVPAKSRGMIGPVRAIPIGQTGYISQWGAAYLVPAAGHYAYYNLMCYFGDKNYVDGDAPETLDEIVRGPGGVVNPFKKIRTIKIPEKSSVFVMLRYSATTGSTDGKVSWCGFDIDIVNTRR